MAEDDVEHLLREIRAARRRLPAAHREILDQLDVQETAVEDWPSGVINLYRTLNEPTPAVSAVEGAAAVWLHERRTVAFNATALRDVVQSLTPASRRHIISAVAWHEYGHALSVHRATADHRARTGAPRAGPGRDPRSHRLPQPLQGERGLRRDHRRVVRLARR